MYAKGVGILSTLIILFLYQSAAYAAYEWRLRSFESSGDVNFFDDFDDGLIDTGPTGSFFNWNNATNTENAGDLVFTDADGINPAGAFGFDLVSFGPIPDDGGVTTLTGVFQPDIAAVQSLPEASGYWIQIFREGGGDGAFLGVFSDGLGNASVAFLDDTSPVPIDSQIVTVASGDIVLQMDLDTTNDLIVARYSTDSGTSFSVLSGSAGLVGNGRFLAGGQGPMSAVPIPQTVWLLMMGLAPLCRRKARRVCLNEGLLR